MSETSCIDQLKCPRTFYHQVIEGVDKYEYQPIFGGIFNILPPIPQPTSDRRVMIIDITYKCPTLLAILESPNQTFPLHTRHVGNTLFVYVSNRLKRISIPTPAVGYQLSDGKTIVASVDLYIEITNVQAFWQSALDPIEIFEAAARRQICQYFLSLSSTTLVTIPTSSSQGPERGIYEINLVRIKDCLEQQLRNMPAAGITIDRAEVHIDLNDMLKAWIDRQYQKIWGERGIFERLFVDIQINDDTTFPNRSLREVMLRVDRRLLENFYLLPFGEAMQKVHARMAELKNDYLTRYQQELETLQQYLQIAKDREIDQMHMDQLKDKLAARLESCANDAEKNSFRTDEMFFADLF